jgi:hypothetical protein
MDIPGHTATLLCTSSNVSGELCLSYVRARMLGSITKLCVLYTNNAMPNANSEIPYEQVSKSLCSVRMFILITT